MINNIKIINKHQIKNIPKFKILEKYILKTKVKIKLPKVKT